MSTWDDKPNDYAHACAIIVQLREHNATLRAAMEEYACTGSDTPCGCYRVLSQEKTVIAVLREDLRMTLAALEGTVELLEEIEAWSDKPNTLSLARAAIAKAKGE